MVRNMNSWQREVIVSGTLCSSVVAIMKTTLGGGSSTVFKRALNDEVESMCTSSIMKILYRSRAGLMLMFSRIISRILSTCVFDAASNSSTSIERLSPISTQEGHGFGSVDLHGVRVGL